MTDSQQLLAEYVANGSEAAFRELVTRYLDLVYSSARRLVNGDAHLAQDVAQTVFVDLARLARTLPRQVMLGGWLHRHTCFVAATVLRGERRRRLRERRAAEMNALNHETEAGLAHLAPVLDEAINELGTKDRAAILLRFFEQRDLRAVAEAMGSSENAAQKRVSRAVEELRVLLRKRGVALSAAALGTVLASQAVTAAPAALAVSISATALTSAAAGGSTAVTLLKLITMSKIKIGILSALAVAAVAAPLVVQKQSIARLQQENHALQAQQQQLTQLTSENERLSNLVAQASHTPSFAPEQEGELLRLRGEVGELRRQSQELVSLRTENQRLQAQASAALAQGMRRGGPTVPPEVAARNACINNLRQLDGAIQQWALEYRKRANDPVTLQDCTPYLKNSVICPAGGTSIEDSYQVIDAQTAPRCIASGGGEAHGHVLP